MPRGAVALDHRPGKEGSGVARSPGDGRLSRANGPEARGPGAALRCVLRAGLNPATGFDRVLPAAPGGRVLCAVPGSARPAGTPLARLARAALLRDDPAG